MSEQRALRGGRHRSMARRHAQCTPNAACGVLEAQSEVCACDSRENLNHVRAKSIARRTTPIDGTEARAVHAERGMWRARSAVRGVRVRFARKFESCPSKEHCEADDTDRWHGGTRSARRTRHVACSKRSQRCARAIRAKI